MGEDFAREQYAAKGAKDHAVEEAPGSKHRRLRQRQPVGEGEIDREPGGNRLPQSQRSQVNEPDRPEGGGAKSRGNTPRSCGGRFRRLAAQSKQTEDACPQSKRTPGRERSPPT